MGTPAEGLARLRAAAASGVLDELCARYSIRMDLAGLDAVDVAHLNGGGPVIKERALVGSVA